MGDEYPASMSGGVGGGGAPPPPAAAGYAVDDMNAWMLLTAAALLEMVATSRVIDLMSQYSYYPESSHAAKADWVLFCACFTVFVVLLVLLARKFVAGGMPVAASCASVFLVVLWLFGTGVATFSFPFPNVSNGYVAAWVAFASANRLAYLHTANMPAPLAKLWRLGGGFVEATLELPGGASLLCLLVATLVELAQACVVCDLYAYCEEYYAAAIAFGVVSLIAVGPMVFLHARLERFRTVFALFILVWWTLGLFLLTTFYDVFASASSMNGFVSVWAAFFGAWTYATTAGFQGLASLSFSMTLTSRKAADGEQPAPQFEGDAV